MGLFSRPPKPDPISERSRALNVRIAALEAEIRRLSEPPPPDPEPGPPRPRREDPQFESLPGPALEARPAAARGPTSATELGVGRTTPPGWRGWWERVRRHLGGASPTNPQLISYLAAGGIQGLRPLRYERRIARNRLLFLLAVVALILLLLVMVFLRTR
ncbi:MAG: hypothetical protein ACKVYV_09420 [Limisphaerales bacterium]